MVLGKYRYMCNGDQNVEGERITEKATGRDRARWIKSHHNIYFFLLLLPSVFHLFNPNESFCETRQDKVMARSDLCNSLCKTH